MAVSRTAAQFTRRLDYRGQQIGRQLNYLKIKVGLAVHREVVLGTPVDTGRARSNWQVSIGVPLDNEIEPYAPGQKLGIGEGANAQGAINQGVSVLAGRVPRLRDTVWISNNVHYIGSLNAGSSAQAGAQFVQRAMLVGARVAAGGRLLRGN